LKGEHSNILEFGVTNPVVK